MSDTSVRTSEAAGAPQWRVAPAWPARKSGPGFFRTHRALTYRISIGFLVVIALYAILVPLFANSDPRLVYLDRALQAPSSSHWLGTDLLGRDLLVRCAQGLRISLLLAVAAAAVSTVVGLVVGTLSGLAGGIVDKIVMRLVDATNALPHLLLGVVIAALWRGQAWAVIVSIGLTHWTQVARIVRSEILHVRTREHVLAAVAQGATRRQVWLTHLVPAVVPQALVAIVLLMPHAVWHESSLSFLGVGLPPNDPSLGTLLQDARAGILAGGWWLLAFPAGLLTAVCLAVAGIGARLRDKAMPRRAVESEEAR